MTSLRFYQLPLVGRCGVETRGGEVARLLIGSEATGEDAGACDPVQEQVARQLEEYLTGRRRRFDLPLRPDGTAFQRRVWQELQRLEWGQSVTYGQLAARLGSSGAARAVGRAVGANPIPIIVPCHRILGAGERLGGFRLGRSVKEQLLELEGIVWR